MKTINLSILLVLSLLACGQPSAQETAQGMLISAANSNTNVTTATLRVTGMTCKSCENHVKKVLMKLPGVSDVIASHKEEKVVVTFDKQKVTLEQIKSAITELEYHVS